MLLNYRQWKKKFKKAHGRNPYPWEDKRKIATQYTQLVERLPDMVNNAIATIAEVFSRAFQDFSDVLAKVAKDFSQRGEQNET